MTRHIADFLPRTARWLVSKIEIAAFRWRWLWVKCTRPEVSIHRSVRISQGVRLQATDGGRITLRAGCYLSPGTNVIARGGHIELGENTFIGYWSTLASLDSISVGRNSLVAERVTIRDQDHKIDGMPDLPIRLSGFECSPVTIGEDVWIAAGACVLKGVQIGNGTVVAANSVVIQSMGERLVVGGAPAKVIRRRAEKDN